MIQAISFKNFKGLRDNTIELDRLTVFVGPNASGKTTILQGISLVKELAASRPEDVFQGEYGTDYLAGSETTISVEATAGDITYTVSGMKKSEKWSFEQSFPTKTGVSKGFPPAEFKVESNSTFLRLDSKKLTAPFFAEKPIKKIEQDGTGLASVLAYMALNQPDVFSELLLLVQSIFPFVQKVRFDRVEIPRKTPWGDTIVMDMVGAPNVPAHFISDGTILVLGLLSVIIDHHHSHVILLDDLDQGLHPKAQKDLMELFRKILQERPGLQIIATTHSPYLLDQAKPEEVRLTTRREDGSVACARLNEHPDFDRWREAMSPGEFWSMVGESWVAERNAEVATP